MVQAATEVLMPKMSSMVSERAWMELMMEPSVDALERYAIAYPEVLEPGDLDAMYEVMHYDPTRLVCPTCGADESDIQLDLVEAQNQCRQCGVVWACSFKSQLEHPEIARAVCSGPWDKATTAVVKTTMVPYHASDNFVRYLTTRIKGWSFKCPKREETLVCERLRALDHPTLSQFRKIVEDLGLRKYYQRFPQFLALAFPDRLVDLLTEFESPHFRRLIQLHRGYVAAFEQIKDAMGCVCFPNRGFTACYLMYRDPETWKYIQYMNLPRLRETAQLNLRRLQTIEIQMISMGRLSPTEVTPAFPLHLFYDDKRLKTPMPTVGQMEQSMHSFS